MSNIESIYGPAPLAQPDLIVWRLDSEPYQRGNGHVARYVPYVNASICAALLDQWVGPENWQDEYMPIDAHSMWCKVMIYHPGIGEWVAKRDIGVAPRGDEDMAAKGLVSDAFKRAACLKWGVARNVYFTENTFAPCEVRTNRQGKERAFMSEAALDHLGATAEAGIAAMRSALGLETP